MKGRLRPARVVLLGQMLLVGLFLQFTGRLQPQLVPDSQHYLEFSWDSPSAVLGQIRTPGYPAFLTLAAPGGNIGFVPEAHYVAYCLSVVVFAAGLKRLGVAEWPRMWTASALLYANILHGYVTTIASDTLAAALAVAAAGLLFSALHRPRFLVPLGLCATAAWLVRPAYLSLVVQLPLLGAAVLLSRRSWNPEARRIARTALVLAATTLVPLIAYCTLRSAVVGRFGVVAFGGFNVIGIAGQFLDEPMVESLPVDVQPVARLALTRRAAADESDPRLMSDAPVLNYQRMENRYDHTMWNIFRPAAEQIEPSDASSVNTRLRRLAQAIIRERPMMYAVYLAKAFRRAVFKIVGDTVLNPYCLGLCLLIVGVDLFRILRPVPSAVTNDASDRVQPSSVQHRASRGAASLHSLDSGLWTRNSPDLMTLTAFIHAACQLAVVILVCPPLGRMTDAMALFVPALLMTIFVDRIMPPVNFRRRANEADVH
ncbi:MAG: hypothetical protein AB7U20_14460 [Planctomycetaceae bacterium]